MALLFVIGILLLAASAGLLARAITLARARTVTNLRQIDDYGFHATEGPRAQLATPKRASRTLNDLAERIGGSVKGTGWRAPVTTPQLRGAGLYGVTPEMFQGYRVMLTGTLCSLILFDTVLAGSFSIITLPLAVVAAALAWLGPAALVGTRAQRRMDRVDRDLPELIDLLIATIEAGLGFAGSLQLVADRFHGPLGQELRLTLGEQNMGLSTERALANLLERCQTQSVRAFVRAVSQAESLGVSIGMVMRNLAAETRKRRREAAKEKVQKAPVKMLFPLVFMIFPALLIVLLYPAFYQLMTQLGGR
jgi:tight adherence protein C